MGAGKTIVIIGFFAILGIFSSINGVYGQAMELTPFDNLPYDHSLAIIVSHPGESGPIEIEVLNLGPSAAGGDIEVISTNGPDRFRGDITVRQEAGPGNPDGEINCIEGDSIQVSYLGVFQTVLCVSDEETAYPTGNIQIIDDDFRNGCTDVDDDFICDIWEQPSFNNVIKIDDGNGHIYEYDCMETGNNENPHPTSCSSAKKDIFIEINWMEGHEPDPDAIAQVFAAFNAHGIANIHLQVDSEPAINHDPDIIFPGYDFDWWPAKKGFDQIKGNHYGTAKEKIEYDDFDWDAEDPYRILKHQIFRYCLFIHDREGWTGQSGTSEINGNDCLISLGSFTGEVGSTDQQAGTLMHEIGHMMGLLHGGADWKNNKPNYFSSMSYARQFADIDPNITADFSSANMGNDHTLQFLDESLDGTNDGLVEAPKGMNKDNLHPWHKVIYSCPDRQAAPLIYIANAPIDWNCDLDLDNDVHVSTNINDLPSAPNLALENLNGYDDWNKLKFNFNEDSDYADGRHLGIPSGGSSVESPPGIAGGLTPPNQISQIGGIPPGFTMNDLIDRAGGFTPPGRSDSAGGSGPPGGSGPSCPPQCADENWSYDSVEEKEMDVEMTILNRISVLLTLYREIELIPEDVWNSAFPDDSGHIVGIEPDTANSITSIQFQSTGSKTIEIGAIMVPSPTAKKTFSLAVKDAISKTNHHDIQQTLELIEDIDFELSQSLNEKAQLTVRNVSANALASSQIALDFKPTSIHNNSKHVPSSTPIIDQMKITDMINEVDGFVTTISLPNSDSDGIPDRYDECPDDSTAFEKPCPVISGPDPDPTPWQLFAALIVLIFVIIIAIWRAINP